MVIGQAFTQAMTSFFHNNQFHDRPNTALLGPGGALGGGSQRKLSCPEKVCFLSVWQAAGWVGVRPGQFAPQIQRSWAGVSGNDF